MKKKAVFSLMLLALIAATATGQVKFPENLEHYDPTMALVDQEQIRGHHWSVIDKTARNNIPEDKREIGMLATWIENSQYTTKRFQGSNTTNVEWTDDLNWSLLVSQADTITYADTSFYALRADTASVLLNPIEVDSISFKGIVSATSHSDGALKYDTITHSLQFQNDIVEFSHNLGYELVVRVYNNSGAQIDNGKVVTLAGLYVNGYRTPTIKLAQIDSITNLKPIGVATTNIANDSYGIVTLTGEVKGVNTSSFPSGSPLYVDANGGLRLDPPAPPEFALEIGYSFFADATDGSIYIQSQPPGYFPSPHISADTSRYNQTLTINTIGVFEYLPISDTNIEDQHGFQVIGDSILCEQAGAITVALNLSYVGNSQSDVWRKGLFINGLEVNTVSRSTASTSVGNSTVIATVDILAGDYLSFKMTNESATRDPDIVDLSWEIIYLHR